VTGVLLQEDTDGVRVLTLNRPGARNALSTPLVEALHAALLAADAQDQVRVLVLTGADQTTLGPALAAEREIAARHVPDWAGLEQRRVEVMARNRAQIRSEQEN